MPLTWLKEHIVKSAKFWGVWFIVCFVIFMLFIGFTQWEQKSVQKETLVEAKHIQENRKILEDVLDMQKTIRENGEMARQAVKEIRDLVILIKQNQEYLKQNRALWADNFVILYGKIDEATKRLDEHLEQTQEHLLNTKGGLRGR